MTINYDLSVYSLKSIGVVVQFQVYKFHVMYRQLPQQRLVTFPRLPLIPRHSSTVGPYDKTPIILSSNTGIIEVIYSLIVVTLMLKRPDSV